MALPDHDGSEATRGSAHGFPCNRRRNVTFDVRVPEPREPHPGYKTLSLVLLPFSIVFPTPGRTVTEDPDACFGDTYPARSQSTAPCGPLVQVCRQTGLDGGLHLLTRTLRVETALPVATHLDEPRMATEGLTPGPKAHRLPRPTLPLPPCRTPDRYEDLWVSNGP